MTALAVELDHVTLTLSGRTILSDVSLAIEPGQFIGVLGPNGAGKTTLMRALLGLVPPAHGTLRVLGEPLQRGNPRIAYLPQVRTSAAVRRLRGRDFVLSSALGHRWGRPWPDAKVQHEVDRALAQVGAAQLAARPLAELSGGERQRLLLAQCLLGEPDILLLDEPLISLDPSHQSGVVELVRELQQRLRITVLFSAHELNPLLGALDQVLYLGHGHAALGTVDDVITGPVLSRLYGAPIEVERLHGRIFVMSGAYEVEHAAHVGHSHNV